MKCPFFYDQIMVVSGIGRPNIYTEVFQTHFVRNNVAQATFAKVIQLEVDDVWSGREN